MLKFLICFTLLALINLAQPESVNNQTLETIQKYIDERTKPCNDYFQYACGNWGEQHESVPYHEAVGLVDHNINQKLVRLMEDIGKQLQNEGSQMSASVEAKVWYFYNACQSQEKLKPKIYFDYVQPYGNVSWPLLAPSSKNWPKDQFRWLETLAELRRYGLRGTLIDHAVVQRPEKSQNYLIEFDMPFLEGDREPMQLITIMAMLDVLDVNRKNLFRIAQKLSKFDQRVYDLTQADFVADLQVLSIKDLINNYPGLEWHAYFEIVLNHKLNDTSQIQMRNSEYFQRLFVLLKKTEAETICNYLMVKFVYYMLSDGRSSNNDVDCISDVRSKMDVATNYIYGERFFGTELERISKEVRGIFNVLRYEFLAKVEKNTLRLKPRELTYVRDKLKKMRLNIGNLPQNLNKTEFVYDYYKTLELKDNKYTENHLKLLAFRSMREHELMTAPVADFFLTDSSTAQSSTPFYLMRRNIVVVPYGILQPPMFDANMHDVFKMSLLGFLLAHEMVHGFDVTGITYDLYGDERRIGANMLDKKFFVHAHACMQRNETESLDERIADISGIRLAYDVMFGSSNGRQQQYATQTYYNTTLLQFDTRQPDFTSIPIRELFFLNFAQFFCGDLDTEFSDHDADDIRLRYTLHNFLPFAETYRCKPGVDNMHPEPKCRLW